MALSTSSQLLTAGDSSRGIWWGCVESSTDLLGLQITLNDKMWRYCCGLVYLFVCGGFSGASSHSMNIYFFSPRMGEDSKPSACTDCCKRAACLSTGFIVITFTASTNSNPPLLSSWVNHRPNPALLWPQAASQAPSPAQPRSGAVTACAELVSSSVKS